MGDDKCSFCRGSHLYFELVWLSLLSDGESFWYLGFTSPYIFVVSLLWTGTVKKQ